MMSFRYRCVLAGVLGVFTCLSAARAQPESESAVPDNRHALIICGHPGDDEHRALYAETVEKLHRALTSHYGFAAGDIRILFGSETGADDGPALQAARGLSTKDTIKKEVAGLREELEPDDGLWVIALGHAHYDGRRSWLNLPDRDMPAAEFGSLFERLDVREEVFFITTPVSGFFLRPLARDGRIVISATEADLEVNETIFPLALAEVLAAPPEPEAFDADEDGTLSVFDLYIAVAREVADRYVQDELLATEHAQLDDNGDGRGTEVQIDYLTEEQGGRADEDFQPPERPPGADGTLAQSVRLRDSGPAVAPQGGVTHDRSIAPD